MATSDDHRMDGPTPRARRRWRAEEVADLPVLTVHQPWASLLVRGVKDVENRTWATSHRGPMLVHAAVKLRPDLLSVTAEHAPTIGPHGFPRGVVLGLVDLLDVVEHDPSPWAIEGHRHWKVRPLLELPTPIPASGQRAMWRLRGDALARVQRLFTGK